MANKRRIDNAEAAFRKSAIQRASVVVEKMRWRDNSIKALPGHLGIKAGDVMHLNDNQSAGPQESMALLECGHWVANMIEDVLKGDDVEVIFAHRVVFKRSDHNPVAIALSGSRCISGSYLVAMTLPSRHHIKKPAPRTPYIQKLPGLRVAASNHRPKFFIIVIEAFDVCIVVRVICGAGVMSVQFLCRDLVLNECQRASIATRNGVAVHLPARLQVRSAANRTRRIHLVLSNRVQ